VILVNPPPLPVTVTVCVPKDALAEANIVKVLVKGGIPLDGLNEKDRPLADVEAESETDGLLALVTVKEYEADLDRPPPLPVMDTLYVPVGVPDV
jgi:hypothetical protein